MENDNTFARTDKMGDRCEVNFVNSPMTVDCRSFRLVIVQSVVGQSVRWIDRNALAFHQKNYSQSRFDNASKSPSKQASNRRQARETSLVKRNDQKFTQIMTQIYQHLLATEMQHLSKRRHGNVAY